MAAAGDNTGIGVAVQLELDAPASEAFLRLAKGLPGLALEVRSAADALALLGEDLVVVPAVKAAETTSLELALADLKLLLAQISDPATKARISGAIAAVSGLKLGDVAVPQPGKTSAAADVTVSDLAAQGGLLNPAQGSDLVVVPGEGTTFVVQDSSGKVVSTHETQEEAVAATLRKFDIRVLKAAADPKKEEPAEERTVFGIVLEPETVDSQNDVYSAEEIRKTAFKFMEEYQQFGLMHKKIVKDVVVLESFIAPVDFEAGGQQVKKGTWLVRVRVLDNVIWKKVKSGELTGFSIGGSAVRKPDRVAA